MRHLIAFLFPPAAILLCGRPGSALLNCVLTLLLYFLGLIHGLVVVAVTKAESRHRRLVRALRTR